jgi:hypothetical protein
MSLEGHTEKKHLKTLNSHNTIQSSRLCLQYIEILTGPQFWLVRSCRPSNEVDRNVGLLQFRVRTDFLLLFFFVFILVYFRYKPINNSYTELHIL